MKNNPQIKNTLRNKKYFTILIVCIVAGFIIGYSYNISKDNRTGQSNSNAYTRQGENYQQQLIEQQERNKQLAEEYSILLTKIRQYEQDYTTHDRTYEALAEEAQQLRLLLGELPAYGQGLAVTLTDNMYGSTDNPNDYIVHESHVFSVINELKIAGAEAIMVNGQRLRPTSYISCNGPVITIDGNQYPAPFVIEAVGNSKTLLAALEIGGGVFDQLLADHIVVTLEEKQMIQMPALTKGNT